MSIRRTAAPRQYQPGFARVAKQPLVEIRRSAGLLFLRCRGCGRAGSLVRTIAELSVTEVPHAECPVASRLWRSLVERGLTENGRVQAHQQRKGAAA